MNDWIKRYVHDVARRLPESQRDEVKKELEANIGDMLPEQPTEADIKAVLTTLGARAHSRVELPGKTTVFDFAGMDGGIPSRFENRYHHLRRDCFDLGIGGTNRQSGNGPMVRNDL
ncbi:MAG: hypothetical protein MZU97_17045 [Bacillus subtilis]|nr:hypothetical protein [Bacillus subtilis]